MENEGPQIETLEGNLLESDRSVTAARSWVLFWLTAFFALSLDQVSKWVALSYLDPYRPVEIIPNLFELRLVHNDGAAFSILPGGRWLFVLVSVAAALFLPLYQRSLLKEGEGHWLFSLGLGLIWGGAMGNAIDRVARAQGLVVDFIHFYLPGYQFPVFNVADSAITLGLGAVLFVTLFPSKPAGKESRQPDAPDTV